MKLYMYWELPQQIFDLDKSCLNYHPGIQPTIYHRFQGSFLSFKTFQLKLLLSIIFRTMKV
jgi:hypothetical protein